MNKKKVLLLQPDLADYRVETYNYLADKYIFDVAYAIKDKTKAECKFNKMRLDVCKFGPFFWVKGLEKLCNKYDVVIMMADLHYPQYCFLPFKKRKFKVLSWGIGFRVSYTKPYITDRKLVFMDRITQKVLNKCDANIFYMENSKVFWKRTNLDLNKCFVAPNTTSVAKIDFLPECKQNFLFVGTLYKGKGLDLLLNAYKCLLEMTDANNKLVIIGDGAERQNLELYVKENNLINKVEFKGAIYDEYILAQEFQKALLCISPTQGGLSCPKSMGYGVPFVVRKDAITGGEIYHTTSGLNGVLYDKDEELLSIMRDAVKNPQKYIKMGKLAKEYYNNNATPLHMANGAMKAIEYALESK